MTDQRAEQGQTTLEVREDPQNPGVWRYVVNGLPVSRVEYSRIVRGLCYDQARGNTVKIQVGTPACTTQASKEGPWTPEAFLETSKRITALSRDSLDERHWPQGDGCRPVRGTEDAEQDDGTAPFPAAFHPGAIEVSPPLPLQKLETPLFDLVFERSRRAGFAHWHPLQRVSEEPVPGAEEVAEDNTALQVLTPDFTFAPAPGTAAQTIEEDQE